MDQFADMADYIDVEQGLARIRGNKAVYVAILNSFAGDTHVQQLCKEALAQDFESAAKTIHTIKGLAGNLSLPAAHNASVLLETQLKSNRLSQNDLDAFVEVIDKTLTYVDTVLQIFKKEV